MMSYPYPQDRHRDRKEKGEQPYKDAKETIAQQEAAEPVEAHQHGQPAPLGDQPGEADDMVERLRAIEIEEGWRPSPEHEREGTGRRS